MKIWQVLDTCMTAIGLTELLLGREITMSDGTSIGVVADMKLDLAQGKIWVVIDNQKQRSMISSEQLISPAHEANLIDDCLPA